MMGEIHLWQWRYTDDFGRRRIFPCKLTEEDAKHARTRAAAKWAENHPQP
jgi:hypothetical protein